MRSMTKEFNKNQVDLHVTNEDFLQKDPLCAIASARDPVCFVKISSVDTAHCNMQDDYNHTIFKDARYVTSQDDTLSIALKTRRNINTS